MQTKQRRHTPQENRMRPITPQQVGNVKQAIECLRAARDLLKTADCRHTVNRVRLSLSSAYGALRHVNHRRHRTNTDGTSRHYMEDPR